MPLLKPIKVRPQKTCSRLVLLHHITPRLRSGITLLSNKQQFPTIPWVRATSTFAYSSLLNLQCIVAVQAYTNYQGPELGVNPKATWLQKKKKKRIERLPQRPHLVFGPIRSSFSILDKLPKSLNDDYRLIPVHSRHRGICDEIIYGMTVWRSRVGMHTMRLRVSLCRRSCGPEARVG